MAATAIMLGRSPSSAVAPPAMVVSVVQFSYLPGDWKLPPELAEVRISAGGTLHLANADVFAPHTLSSPPSPEETFLFTSETADPGEVVEVAGVSSLAPGVYPFTCLIHMDLMRGRLVVEPPS